MLIPVPLGVIADSRPNGGGGGGGPTATFQQAAASGTDGTSFTFTAQPIGTASATRRVVVAIGYGGPAAPGAISSVTIGGVTATIDVDSGALTNNRRVAIASAVVPTGTTADVVITFGVTVGRVGIGVWTLSSGAPTGQTALVANNATGTLTVTTVAGQVVIATGYASRASGTLSTAWTNATERYDQTTENTFDITTGADAVAAGTSTAIPFTVTSDVTTSQANGFVAAAYG